MAKANPNRQELLQFINSLTSQLDNQVKKIEDLSSGIHYLHLLHQVHPDVVKMAKVNLKASQEYENVNNLRLLASYLAQVKAPFTFQVPKVSQKNYQENLNLLKNLYKHYYLHSKKDRSLNASVDSRVSLNASIDKKTSKPKLIPKPPQKPVKTLPVQKFEAENSGFKGMVNDSKSQAQQIRKILIVVREEEKNPQDVTAQEKLNRIKKILGLQSSYVSSKKKAKALENQQIHYSTRFQESKSSSKKNPEVESEIKNKKQTEETKEGGLKSENKKITQNLKNSVDQKKVEKQFDCQEIKQNALKKYELRSVSTRKNRDVRISKDNVHLWANSQEEDTRYNQNLLSPDPGVLQHSSKQKQHRKTILRKSQNFNSQILRNESLRKVHFTGGKSQRKDVTSNSKEIEPLSVKKWEKKSIKKEVTLPSEKKERNNSVEVKQDILPLSNKKVTDSVEI